MLKTSFAAVALATLPFAANAATINVSVFNAASYNGSYTGANKVTQDFETLGNTMGEGQVGAALPTNVGSIATLGGVGTGGTVTQTSQPSGNNGTQLALRDGNVFGRTNTTPNAGKWFLDSNDTWGMTWNVSLAGNQSFTALAFSLMDANDTGAKLRVQTGTDVFETSSLGLNGQGNVKLVEIDFGGAVTSATVTLGNYKTVGGSVFKLNDGFSIDGLQVVAVAPVPVPASMLMMASGLAGLAALRRRKKAA